MADITKCTGKDCKIKNKCYRYTAKSGVWQPWFSNSPLQNGICKMFWGEQTENIYNQLKEIVKQK